ncbi:jg22226 [Pararge aegeria aegeria]|uniref:Jg22226 protein n=1 Tax=Pararge aegeria aegeria TaxID=348720 RepID=A0A8S4SLE0_9NEOP|nr:jg22226 [Pararge aegeria aegeria]
MWQETQLPTFHILAVNIRNVDKKGFVRVDGINYIRMTPRRLLLCGRMGTEEQDCEVPEHEYAEERRVSTIHHVYFCC